MRRDPRRQGDLGELSAIRWLVEHGADVFLPMSHCRDYDLIADFGQGLVRVQAKTSTQFRKGRWSVTVCTRGGNRSWNGLVKRLDPENYDYLFVLVGEGRRWFIPSKVVGGGSGISLGGPRYAEFEIDRDPAGLRELYASRVPLRREVLRIEHAPRRDTRAVKGTRL
jgi:PD-(D/E)XK endonuclease